MESISKNYTSLFIVAVGIGFFIFTLFTFYPGYMSHDSYAQYVQVKSGDIFNHHPPIIVYLWKVLDKIIEGGGGIFTLFSAVYWIAIILIAYSLGTTLWQKIGIMLFLGFFPPHFIMIAQVMKDAGVLASFLFAVAMILFYLRKPRILWLALAFMMLIFTSCARHNSFLAVIPLLYFISHLFIIHPIVASWINTKYLLIAKISMTVILTIFIQLVIYYVNVVNVKSVALWPSLAVWDIAAVSVMSGEMLLPEYTLTDKHMDITRVKEIFSEVTNTSLCAQNPSKKNREVLCRESFRFRAGDGLKTEVLPQLFRDWLYIISHNFRFYVKHRIRITEYMLGIKTKAEIMPFNTTTLTNEQFKNASFKELGVKVIINDSSLNKNVVNILYKIKDTVFFRAWFFLMILIIAALYNFRKTTKTLYTKLSTCLAISGVFYVAPLVVLSASLDFRYSILLVTSSLLMLLLEIAPPVILTKQNELSPLSTHNIL